MSLAPHPWLRAVGDRLSPARVRERVGRLRFRAAGHGYDAFGLHPDWIRFGAGLTSGLYERWFRVQSHDAGHLPPEGGAILAANHSGTLPFDAAMIYGDVLRHTEPPRVVRPVLDHFVPNLPVVSTFFARVGAVGGSRGNVQRLLEAGELVLMFPEGAPWSSDCWPTSAWAACSRSGRRVPASPCPLPTG